LSKNKNSSFKTGMKFEINNTVILLLKFAKSILNCCLQTKVCTPKVRLLGVQTLVCTAQTLLIKGRYVMIARFLTHKL
jgi:hypothetical protein